MKKLSFLIVSLVFIFLFGCSKESDKQLLLNGDIVFLKLDIPHIKPLISLSNSQYTHCGIVFLQKDSVYVFEAGGKVDLINLNVWKSRKTKDSTIVVKRLKKEYINKLDIPKLIKEGKKYSGLYTDVVFNWSDSLFYGSELVWKMYKRGLGIELSATKTMKDWNNKDKYVLFRIKDRYKIESPFVLEDTVISPDDIFNSEKLETIYEGKIVDLKTN